jgi:CubicO group peptidase (beta-lactamase class C family)
LPESPEILGTFDERFAGVHDALADNFRERGELGAAVAIAVEGRPVVDIWAGWMDAERTRPWRHETLVAVFSVGKAMASICLLMLVDRGQVELDAPVARYWPEFGNRGKGEITVRMLMSHRAGLPAVRDRLPDEAIFDWGTMTAALAAEAPWWKPGSKHGYHVNTFGFLVGEIVRRVSGQSIGGFFREEVADPLGADFHFGFGPQDDERTAAYQFPADPSELAEAEDPAQRPEDEPRPGDEDRHFMLGRVYLNPPGLSGLGTVNTRPWRAAEIPSANGHATARGVARVYGELLAGLAGEETVLLEGETIEQAIMPASEGRDFVLGRPSRFGLGFQLTQPERPLGPSGRAFGHFGAGGSLGFADPDAGLAFAYVMNRSGPRWQNPRNRALIEAIYACL